MPKISFVMPQRNRGDRISNSIKSIVRQTEKDWELIIVDDHSDSDDDTENVIRSFSDSRIRFVKMPRKWPHGIPNARNFGNMLAESDIIAVADSDDLSKPERAEKTLEYFEEGCDVFFSNYEIYNEQEDKLIEPKYKIDEFRVEMLRERNCIPHSSSAYTRGVALQFPYNSFFGRGEDYDFFVRLSLAGKAIAYCPEVLFRYVVHDNNVSGGKKIQAVDDLIKMNFYGNRGERRGLVEDFIENIYK